MRQRIMEIIGTEPGINQNGIAAIIECSPATIMWHVDILVRAKHIWTELYLNQRIFHLVEGGSVARDYSRRQLLLNYEPAKRLLNLLSEQGAMCPSKLTTRLGKRSRDMHHVLASLQEAEIVTESGPDKSPHVKSCKIDCREVTLAPMWNSIAIQEI